MADCVEFLRRFLLFFVAFFCLSLATVPQDQQRKITIKSISCPKNITGCNNTTYIIHVIAESADEKNSMHYLWSVIGSPTIVAAYFDTTDVNVSIDWNQVLINSSTKGIMFTRPSLYITALVIPAIYEFQDKKDELYYTEKDIGKIVKHGFKEEVTQWEEPKVDHKNNVTTFRGKMLGGTVIFQCNASAINDRESKLPHEQFSSNSTVFTLTLDRLTNLDYKKYIRFIFELVSFSMDDS
ncbi:glycosylated lysosomal membrane protein B-like [Stylophora pistillata]|uniref:glycosylated lysosomal membrane protein B-like n=1 Tax=Stylophora pistillata TaxID=50429 RepID=UPI000C04ECBB|nr:glycosylated lysosomal membrane protein B-like [Stylophora pistillata]